jgi:hypothetical protein
MYRLTEQYLPIAFKFCTAHGINNINVIEELASLIATEVSHRVLKYSNAKMISSEALYHDTTDVIRYAKKQLLEELMYKLVADNMETSMYVLRDIDALRLESSVYIYRMNSKRLIKNEHTEEKL